MKLSRNQINRVVLPGIVLTSVYLALFVSEVVLWLLQPSQFGPEIGRGLYYMRDGEVLLKPGYSSHFDDGYGRGEIRINSYGYRGHEPQLDVRSRVLLLGDSFTFGALLDQQETIDAWMEKREPGIEVDNLGVMGYNLPEQLEPLRRWNLPAKQVVYLFYCNDFETPLVQAVENGYRVLRQRRPDGTWMSDEEMRPRGLQLAQRVELSHQFSIRSVLLPRVRAMGTNVYTRLRNRHSSELGDMWPTAGDHSLLVPRALKYTREMRDLAVERNLGFQIAIIPALEEVRIGRYHPLVAQYIAGLRAAGMSVIELMPYLSTDAYWRHDSHFNPKGAKIAADVIYQALKGDSGSIR